MRAELRRREARFIAVKQIKDVKEQIQELKGERVWAEIIENEKVCDWFSKTHNIGGFLCYYPHYFSKVKGSNEREGD